MEKRRRKTNPLVLYFFLYNSPWQRYMSLIFSFSPRRRKTTKNKFIKQERRMRRFKLDSPFSLFLFRCCCCCCCTFDWRGQSRHNRVSSLHTDRKTRIAKSLEMVFLEVFLSLSLSRCYRSQESKEHNIRRETHKMKRIRNVSNYLCLHLVLFNRRLGFHVQKRDGEEWGKRESLDR